MYKGHQDCEIQNISCYFAIVLIDCHITDLTSGLFFWIYYAGLWCHTEYKTHCNGYSTDKWSMVQLTLIVNLFYLGVHHCLPLVLVDILDSAVYLRWKSYIADTPREQKEEFQLVSVSP